MRRSSTHEVGMAAATDEVGRRTVWKLDIILLPFLALLFMLNSLDKSNIGNAETAGFTKDTGLSRSDVNDSMAVFFFVFVLLQPIGAGLGRSIGMRRYVPVCMTLWGFSTILHILVRKRWHLIVLRCVIAVLESGFYPTTVSYMSLFYTKYEFAVRLGIFYGMTAVSGVLGGVLSWAIFSHFPDDGDPSDTPQFPPPGVGVETLKQAHWKSWEILFLVEGCMTMTVALIGFVWLPRSAETAWFLNREERVWAEKRMQLDVVRSRETSKEVNEEEEPLTRPLTSDSRGDEQGTEAHDRLLQDSENNMLRSWRSNASARSITADSGLSSQDILEAVFNYKIWHLLFVNILSAIPATAFGVLLPILVKELSPSLHLSAAASNLLSAPPFACGAILLFAFTLWSDRSRQRLVPILWGLIILLIGLAMAVFAPVDNYWLRYASLCVLLSGSFIASPLTVAWLANNTPEPGKRAILLGINGWGNLAGVFMSVLFTPADRDTGYVRPFTIVFICVLVSFAGFVAFRVFLIRENRHRDNVTRSWSEEEKEREQLMGDVPAGEHWGQRITRGLYISALAQRFGMEDERRGDEKMTYRYTL
ncbi:related to nicotinamide mononucleotide permease [Ramularia collo-cygni]|uniref:Related to nicotinamide mononucleotide permease n=1 Tax=Ramularia collo-cygni TaxID=112498 RepID=A0A2D3V8L9_9PEZI|nr:related to nicotinamide mononucleotide permease [Ramularia collo-cygni]CZT21117.1 related to nicotinamide mononucleotide permease [Ramularia collo-cygni]